MYSESQGFFVDVPRLLESRRVSATRASLSAGVYRGGLGECLRRRTYPLPCRIERLAAFLEAPPEWLAVWLAEANSRNPAQAGRRTTRALHHPPRDVEEVACLRCGERFLREKGSQTKYDSSYCGVRARAQWDDSGLRRILKKVLDRRELNVREAARQIGVSYVTIRHWLANRDHRLRRKTLRAVVDWLGLGIDIEDAERLQGGSSGEHVSELRKKPGGMAHLHTRTVWDAAAATRRGVRLSKKTRQRMSAAAKERWVSGDETQRSKLEEQRARTKSGEFQAQGTFGRFRYRHPDWSFEQLLDATLQRLQEAPFGAKSEREALALLAGERPAEWLLDQRLRGAPDPTDKEISEWARTDSPRLGISIAGLKFEWRQHQKAQGLRGPGGRPADEETRRRFARVDELRASWPKTPDGTLKRDRGFWDAAAIQINEEFGSGFSSTGLYEQWRRYKRRHPSATQAPT